MSNDKLSTDKTVTDQHLESNGIDIRLQLRSSGGESEEDFENEVGRLSTMFAKALVDHKPTEAEAIRAKLLSRSDEMVADLDNVLSQGTAATMTWLSDYSDLAYTLSIRDSQYNEVIEKLEAAGYSSENYLFDREKTDVTPDLMAKLAVGSFLNGYAFRYPGLIKKFAKECLELIENEKLDSAEPNTPGL